MLASAILFCYMAVFQEPSLESQFALAKQCKSAVRGTRGEARIVALKKSAVAFRQVLNFWPGIGPVQAESAFRCAEIYRTLGDAGRARGAFEECLDCAKGTSFGPRALLELGHLLRRQNQWGKAMVRYKEVFDWPNVFLRQENDAREWLGRSWFSVKRGKRAAVWFSAWGMSAESALEKGRALDWEVQAWALTGDIRQAEKRLFVLRQLLDPLAEEPSKEGRAIQKFLKRMKSLEALKEAKWKAGRGTIKAVCPNPSLTD